MKFLLIVLLIFSSIQLTEQGLLDWLKDLWDKLFGNSSESSTTTLFITTTSATPISSSSTSESTATTESTEDPQWYRTLPAPRWLKRQLSDFETQCLQLGAVDFHVIGSIPNSNSAPARPRFKRAPRYSTPPTTTPFTHPKKPPPARYVCMENFYTFVQNSCHPPHNHKMPLDCNETTPRPIDPTAHPRALWVLGEDDPNLSRPQKWNVTEMLVDCCSSTFNQCQCFYRFGEPGTPLEGVCFAVLMEESGRTPSMESTTNTARSSTSKINP